MNKGPLYESDRIARLIANDGTSAQCEPVCLPRLGHAEPEALVVRTRRYRGARLIFLICRLIGITYEARRPGRSHYLTQPSSCRRCLWPDHVLRLR